jgi:acetyl-CoA C-acetyltransferase
MGAFAEDTAATYQFTREAMDDYAIERPDAKAKRAIESGAFKAEIVPVDGDQPQGDRGRRHRRAARQGRSGQDPDPEARPSPRTARSPPPTASSISDGAAALVMTRESVAKALGLPIVAASSATPPTPTSRACSPPPRCRPCKRR